MKEYLAKQPLKRQPTHPGEILREDVLPDLGISVSEAARRKGDRFFMLLQIISSGIDIRRAE